MDCSRIFACKNYVVFVGLMILLVASMLSWITSARLEAFHQYHLDIGHESISGVNKQVAHYVNEKQRMVKLFAEEHIDRIRALASDPNNDALKEDLGILLTRYFPDRFAFSIADNSGEPLFEDFDGLVSELCLSDVKEFSKDRHVYHPYIHPNTEGYHFDIMVRYDEGSEKEGIFFVSFLADVLGNIINSIQSPNHQIMLILPQRDNLIEVIAEGARNHWARDDYRLSEGELMRISMRHDVPGTRWQVIEFHNSELHENYRNKLILESIGIFLIFIFIAVQLVIRLRKEERQREYVQEQKKVLMGVVSHEFRSPASVVTCALDLIADSGVGKANSDVKKYIDLASSSAERLLLLVDDFLDIQKIESRSLEFNKQKSRLRSVVADAVEQNKLYGKQFSVHYELKKPLANDDVFCDENRIGQVLTNFLSNAAKYGGENDTIEVAVKRVGKRLRVSVRDHGPGIPKDFQSRVFEAFAMAHAPKKELTNDQKVKSSGLGLSIAKAIIEHHGGSIGFDTKTDPQSATGTTFWFELPVI